MSDEKTSSSYPTITLLSYCGILCFFPLLIKKENTFTQFHAKQGLALFMIEALIVFISAFIFIPTLSILLLLLCGVISIVGIIHVMQHKETPLPILSWLVEKLNI